MNHFRRLSLTLLLVLLLVGIVGHVLLPTNSAQHVFTESTCAFHHGMNIPVSTSPSWAETGISLDPMRDQSCALDLALNILHPPTF